MELTLEHEHRVALPQLPVRRALPSPRPIARELRPDEVEAHRTLACAHYDDCLDYAVAAGWAGWTCAHCPLHAWSGPIPHIEPGPEISPPTATKRERVRVSWREPVLRALSDGEEHTAADLAIKLRVSSPVAGKILGTMAAAGHVVRVRRGVYRAA